MVAQVTVPELSYGEVKWYEAALVEAYDALACEGFADVRITRSATTHDGVLVQVDGRLAYFARCFYGNERIDFAAWCGRFRRLQRYAVGDIVRVKYRDANPSAVGSTGWGADMFRGVVARLIGTHTVEVDTIVKHSIGFSPAELQRIAPGWGIDDLGSCDHDHVTWYGWEGITSQRCTTCGMYRHHTGGGNGRWSDWYPSVSDKSTEATRKPLESKSIEPSVRRTR